VLAIHAYLDQQRSEFFTTYFKTHSICQMAQVPGILNKDAARDWQIHAAEEAETTRPAKRARVALACQRCKSRKQKVTEPILHVVDFLTILMIIYSAMEPIQVA
jgi:hypothetical protein